MTGAVGMAPIAFQLPEKKRLKHFKCTSASKGYKRKGRKAQKAENHEKI